MKKFRVLPTLRSLLTDPEKPFIHRDLSWLQFNERVLDEARASSGNPLLERVKFLAISSANLDEFFMIRFASLGRALKSLQRHNRENLPAIIRQQGLIDEILETVAKFGAKQEEGLDLLTSELDASGVHIIKNAMESEITLGIGKAIFEKEILPKLSPPETFTLSELHSLENLKTAIIFPDGLWFRISRTIPKMFSHRTDDGEIYYFFLDDLLASFMGTTFGLKGEPGLVRLTRDADVSVDIVDSDPASIPDIVRFGLGSREKGAPVRLQYRGDLEADFLDQAAQTLKLTSGQVLPAPATLFINGLWSLVKELPEDIIEKKALSYATYKTTVPKEFDVGTEIFDLLKRQDLLLHHPYDSFDTLVTWLRAAADDPKVEMIEQTIYRMDMFCPLIAVLKEAAKKKRVRVIIELRARYDQFNNLRLADELRKEGVEVAYGFGKLKVHAKVTLVSRREEGEIRFYSHLSTGNYNAVTAKQYTDLAVLTSHPEIGADARLFFDSAWEGKVPSSFKRLVTAPIRLHRRLLTHIEAEIQAAKDGKKTRIVAKVNALVDEKVVEALYRASQAGVQVDLIVRGACSLIPGVNDLSENIRVISVVDRFLEHSRIYYFESQGAMYLSSADWMPRNFFSRLEIAFPVLDRRIYSYIEKILIPTYLADTIKARELTRQGTWKRRAGRFGKPSVRCQKVFERLAQEIIMARPSLS